MEEPDSAQPSGPPQSERGVKGQYVYWIVASCPTDETVQGLGLRVPSSFTREKFSSFVVSMHARCQVDIIETDTFQELHGTAD